MLTTVRSRGLCFQWLDPWPQPGRCLRDASDLLVPVAEVISLIQRTICLVGNTSELISQTQRARIFEAVDPSWSKYGSVDFPSSSGTIFGEGFQETLLKRVEKDTALSKAVSIMKWAKRTEELSPSSSFSSARRETKGEFFPRGPPARYSAGRAGASFHTIPILPTGKENVASQACRARTLNQGLGRYHSITSIIYQRKPHGSGFETPLKHTER